MIAELSPGPGFEDFFQGTHAAGQGHKGIGHSGHGGFSFVHISNNFQLGQAGVSQLPIFQVFGNHAVHLGALFQKGVCDHAHQADVAAAVHQIHSVRCQVVPQSTGCLGEFRVFTDA